MRVKIASRTILTASQFRDPSRRSRQWRSHDLPQIKTLPSNSYVRTRWDRSTAEKNRLFGSEHPPNTPCRVGTLERYAGDGVMVVFNDPVPVENPALQAVLTALEMSDAIGALTENWRRWGHDRAVLGTLSCAPDDRQRSSGAWPEQRKNTKGPYFQPTRVPNVRLNFNLSFEVRSAVSS